MSAQRKSDSLTGLIYEIWVEDGEPKLDWDQLLERTIAADTRLEMNGLNPAEAFRNYRKARDLEQMKQYITRGFHQYPFSPNYRPSSGAGGDTSQPITSTDGDGGEPATTTDSPSITKLFHRLERILPGTQKLVTVSPETKISEAIRLMEKHGFSQVPVVVRGEVLGMFSFRSFATRALEIKQKYFDPDTLSVDEFIEQSAFARVTDEFKNWFDRLDESDAILVGDPQKVQGIVTTMDVLRYFYGIASPFVLLGEIEVGLRELIRLSVASDQLAECARISLTQQYSPGRMPETLEQMTFNDYIQIVGHGRNWPHFEPVLGGARETTRGKLEQIRDLRNDVFHFRRELSKEDHQDLTQHREWVLLKARTAEARRRKG